MLLVYINIYILGCYIFNFEKWNQEPRFVGWVSVLLKIVDCFKIFVTANTCYFLLRV